MTAPTFLAAFCGCLFALGFVSIAVYMFMHWKVKQIAIQIVNDPAFDAQRHQVRDFARQLVSLDEDVRASLVAFVADERCTCPVCVALRQEWS